MRLLLVTLLTTLTLFTQAQNREYYTYKGQPIPDSINAYYYWETTQLDSALYEQKKYDAQLNLLIERRYCKSLDPRVIHGIHTKYDSTGRVTSTTTYANNMIVDTSYTFSDNGKIDSYTYYQLDTPIVSREFYETGELYEETTYKNKAPFLVNYFYETGEKRRTCTYDNYTLLEGFCYTKTGADTPNYEALIMPELDQSLNNFLKENLIIPKKNLKGSVVVSFLITDHDSVENIKIVYSTNTKLNQCVIDAVSVSSSHWKSALKEGKKVPLTMYLPVNF
jgi:hypothetical protein